MSCYVSYDAYLMTTRLSVVTDGMSRVTDEIDLTVSFCIITFKSSGEYVRLYKCKLFRITRISFLKRKKEENFKQKFHYSITQAGK